MKNLRMRWLVLAVPVVVLTSLIALALQSKKVDDNALKNATKGTEWLSYGMGWSEERYSTMTQINAQNTASSLSPGRMKSVPAMQPVRKQIRFMRMASSMASPTGASSSQSTRRPARRSGATSQR